MKIGLFLSRCDGQLEQSLNLTALAQLFVGEGMTQVVDGFQNSKDIVSILKTVRDEKLEGIILAGNSPEEFKTSRQGELLADLLQDAGVNPNRIAYVNLKDQVARVHGPNTATQQKAELLIEVGFTRVKLAHDMQVSRVSPRKAVAILGTNIEAYLVAEQLLRRNIRVFLIGQQPAGKEETPSVLQGVKAFVELNPKAQLLEDYRLTDLYGWTGDFSLLLRKDSKELTIDVGALLVADNSNAEHIGELRPILHIETGDDGLFVPVSKETKEVYSIEEGIFLIPAGFANNLSGQVALADAAAMAIINLLEEPEILHKNVVSEVDREKCGGCGTCVKTCSFKASAIDPRDRVSLIDAKRCKGCGNCVTSCPTGARDLLTYPQKYLLQSIKILSQFGGNNEPKVLALLCEGCGYKAMDEAGHQNQNYAPNILPLGVRCGGNIDTQLILEAFVHGFDGITICKCAEGYCRNIVGNTDLDRRANLFREILRSRGIDDDKLRIVETARLGDNQCINTIMELLEEIKTAGGDRV